MKNDNSDSGVEFVVDARKLILGFVVFAGICTCFFVLGFELGKRQAGFKEAAYSAPESKPKSIPESRPESADNSSEPENMTQEPPMDWYKNINRKEGDPDIPPAETVKEPEKPKEAPAAAPATIEKPVAKPPAAKAPAAKIPAAKPPAAKPEASEIFYTVQVGAFSQKSQLDVVAKQLKEKGFECRSEQPSPSDKLYLLKVGKFKSRSEAIAMQLRLKKSGFPSFIKTK
jgi:cell division protein FtsN